MRLSRNRDWGHPELIELLKRLLPRPQGNRLDGPPGRRHLAAARRSDADRTRQPSGGPRRRHLADADAEPRAVAQRARGDPGSDDGADDELGVDPNAFTPAHVAVIRAASLSHVERIFVNAAIKKALCRGQRRPRLARQGAADVGPQLSLPHPHQMPGRRLRRMRAPARTARGDGCGTASRLLVHRCGAASEATPVPPSRNRRCRWRGCRRPARRC